MRINEKFLKMPTIYYRQGIDGGASPPAIIPASNTTLQEELILESKLQRTVFQEMLDELKIIKLQLQEITNEEIVPDDLKM